MSEFYATIRPSSGRFSDWHFLQVFQKSSLLLPRGPLAKLAEISNYMKAKLFDKHNERRPILSVVEEVKDMIFQSRNTW